MYFPHSPKKVVASLHVFEVRFVQDVGGFLVVVVIVVVGKWLRQSFESH